MQFYTSAKTHSLNYQCDSITVLQTIKNLKSTFTPHYYNFRMLLENCKSVLDLTFLCIETEQKVN